MARILCIDYGGKRTGIAVTDPLQIIATAHSTIESSQLVPFLLEYVKQEPVELILIGMPKNWDESDAHGTPLVRKAIEKIKKALPHIPLLEVDERYTSKLARQAMVDMGMKKKEREKKGNVDQIAAAMMLQEYIQSRG